MLALGKNILPAAVTASRVQYGISMFNKVLVPVKYSLSNGFQTCAGLHYEVCGLILHCITLQPTYPFKPITSWKLLIPLQTTEPSTADKSITTLNGLVHCIFLYLLTVTTLVVWQATKCALVETIVATTKFSSQL